MSHEPWFKPQGVLDPERHHSFIQNRELIARDAGIPMPLLWKPLPDAISEAERSWMANYRKHRSEGYCGLLLTGEKPKPDPLTRIGAIAGCLSRNFIRARVFPLHEVLNTIGGGATLTASCLLIPDFVSDKKLDKAMPSFRVQHLTALLTERWSEDGLQTVLYAPSTDAIRKEYGSYVCDLVQNHYSEVTV